MAINFPDSPSVNDTHTVLGKTWVWNGTYWKLSGSSNRGISLQVSDTAPSDPVAGDMWYESDTGRTFTYYDGAWIELGNTASVTAFLADTDADTLVHVEESADSDTIAFTTGGTKRLEIDASGHVIPAANETYDLGSASNRFRDLYLSGTSIDLGGAEISSDGTNLTMPPISNISGDFTVDTSTLHVDSTNNRVGIGTTSPNSSLHIDSGSVTNPTHIFTQGYVANTAADTRTGTVRNAFDSNTDFGTYWTSFRGANGGSYKSLFGVRTGGTDNDVLTVDSSGNVGIGTSSPARSPLHLHRADTNATEIHLTNAESGSTNGDGLTIFYDDTTNGSGIWMREAGPLRFATSGSEKMRIDSSGNVGIGTTAPAHDLHVAGGNKALVDGVFSTTSVAEHARLYLNDVNFGIGAGRFGSGSDDDLYLWAYNGAGRGIRFMRTIAGDSAVDGGAWVTSMEINNSGHVLTPSQPAFTARITTTGVTYNGQVLPFSSASLNVGNHYNTSTYLFTAPVSGNYFFSYSILVRTNAGTDRTETGFWKNGGWLMSRGNSYIVSDSVSGHIQASSSVITYMAANDTMGIFQLQGATSDTYGGTSLSIFTGRLVS